MLFDLIIFAGRSRIVNVGGLGTLKTDEHDIGSDHPTGDILHKTVHHVKLPSSIPSAWKRRLKRSPTTLKKEIQTSLGGYG